MTIGQRIRMLRSQLNLTQQEFGARINITQSHIGSIEHNRRALTERALADICREFHVNDSWLRTGNGEMFAETDVWQEARTHGELGEHLSALLLRYDQLDEPQRAPVRGMISSIVQFITPSDEPSIREISPENLAAHQQELPLSHQDYAHLSLVSTQGFVVDDAAAEDVEMAYIYRIGRVAAGVPIEAVQDIDDQFAVPASWRADYVLEVVGDSMEPTYPSGCHIAVRKNSEPPVGSLVVAQLYSSDDPSEVDATFKLLRSRGKTVVLEAINEAYADIQWPRNRTDFLGVVVGMVDE